MRNKRIMLVAGGLAAAALGVLATFVLREPAPPAPAPVVVRPPDPGMPPEPTFPTPEQHARYYGSVLAGEKRALAVVEAALEKAKTGDPAQLAKLQGLRDRYKERIKRHQAKLDL